MFGWCATNHHDQCRRSVPKVVWVEATRKVPAHIVTTDEMQHCECPKRGCKCYVKKADRTKPKKRK